MASLQLNQAAITALAERIVQARRLYGADSAFAIGLFTGLEWLLSSTDLEGARRQIQDRVLELEGGKAAPATPPARAAAEAAGRGRGEGLAENTWIRGTVKWFNNDKGYGFISTAADVDVFVHWRDISSWDRSLTQGDEVEFMVTRTAKGFQAINVMKPGAGGTATAAQGAGGVGQGGDGEADDGAEGGGGVEAAAERPETLSAAVDGPAREGDGDDGGHPPSA